jgi:hypothetical protein
MSMGEVLGVLTSKAVTEAEEAQRALIGACNGLAALDMIEDRLADAVGGTGRQGGDWCGGGSGVIGMAAAGG